MSGWNKIFVLCKRKQKNCCKSWTNWQREILGLDVPFLDEKIIAKYLRILPSHWKAAEKLLSQETTTTRDENKIAVLQESIYEFFCCCPFLRPLKLLRYSISICMNKTPICIENNSWHTSNQDTLWKWLNWEENLRTFYDQQIRAATPSEISPSGCYTFGMFHLRTVTTLEVSPSESYTFGLFTFGLFQKLWKV